MICPRDNIHLLIQSIGDVDLYYCDQCFGMWFTRENLKEMLFESKEHKYLPDLAVPAVTHDPDSENTLCPADHHAVMSSFEFEGVKLDICRKHQGVWLDYGELMILYAAYLRETEGESFFKEDTTRFISSLFMRKMPITISEEGKIEMSGFLASLNAVLKPLDIIRWILTRTAISRLFEEEEGEKEKEQEQDQE